MASRQTNSNYNYLISEQLLNHYKNNILPQCNQSRIRKSDFLPHYRARSYPLYIDDNFIKLSDDDQYDDEEKLANNDKDKSYDPPKKKHKSSRHKPKINKKISSLSPNITTSSSSDTVDNNNKCHRIVSEYIVNDNTSHKFDKVTNAFELIDDDHCIVGEGTYGVVFRAYSKPNGKDVAVKGIRCDDGYLYQMDEKAHQQQIQQQQQQQQSQQLSETQINNNGWNGESISNRNGSMNDMDDSNINGNSENINNYDEKKDGDNDKNKKHYKSLIASRHSSFMTSKLAIKKKMKQFNDQIGIPHTAIQELQTLQRLQHKNIVNLIDVVSNRTFDCVPCDVLSAQYLKLLLIVWKESNKYKDKYPNFKLPEMPSVKLIICMLIILALNFINT